MSKYFPSYKSSGKSIRVNLTLSNYATKTDLKNVTHVDVSNFALKTSFASFKTKVEKLDIHNLVPIPKDLAKLSNGVKMMLSKRLNMKN